MTPPTAVELGEYLELMAKAGKVIAYSDLSDHFKFPKKMPWKDNPLYPLLGDITKADKDARRPLRISIVVKKVGEKKTIPSDGYFRTIAAYRRELIASTASEKRTIHDRELKATLANYGYFGEPDRS